MSGNRHYTPRPPDQSAHEDVLRWFTFIVVLTVVITGIMLAHDFGSPSGPTTVSHRTVTATSGIR